MRVVVRIVAVLLALAIATAGALLAVEVGWRWLRPDAGPLVVPWPRWRAELSTLTWESTPVRVTALITAVAGLLLLVAALATGRRDVALLDPAPGVTVRTSPRSLARIVGTRVRAQDDVSGATVSASRRKVRVRASSAIEPEARLRPRLTGVVGAVLADLPLARTPRVSVVVDSPRDRP
ncbi:DUF6286 domain-containing protein [Actinokineospora fastidiosa]|uniref:DUF6286 domain-containing protein n=1 Tax=Actinokineospora fastidiosa TaxID=1816 RepID=A0A918GP44_9PSEU|nr:DUF6286 domain-containing protein [Actinokineospora fastidiosa]GGS50300.1 hypothetical protein GCM10010171_51830 [Actinokineospora fastidiosa]